MGHPRAEQNHEPGAEGFAESRTGALAPLDESRECEKFLKIHLYPNTWPICCNTKTLPAAVKQIKLQRETEADDSVCL